MCSKVCCGHCTQPLLTQQALFWLSRLPMCHYLLIHPQTMSCNSRWLRVPTFLCFCALSRDRINKRQRQEERAPLPRGKAINHKVFYPDFIVCVPLPSYPCSKCPRTHPGKCKLNFLLELWRSINIRHHWGVCWTSYKWWPSRVSAHSAKCRASHEHSGNAVCSEGQYVGITPGRKEILFVRQGLIDPKMISNLVPCQGQPELLHPSASTSQMLGLQVHVSHQSWCVWCWTLHILRVNIKLKSLTSSFKVNTCLPYDCLEKWMSTQACSCWQYHQWMGMSA